MKSAPTWYQYGKKVRRFGSRTQIEAQQSGFDLERRSDEMNELWLF